MGGIGVEVGGIGVDVGGTGVEVGGIGVSVGGTGVEVGGTGVLVGGTGVEVGGIGVAVGGVQASPGLPPFCTSIISTEQSSVSVPAGHLSILLPAPTPGCGVTPGYVSFPYTTTSITSSMLFNISTWSPELPNAIFPVAQAVYFIISGTAGSLSLNSKSGLNPYNA